MEKIVLFLVTVAIFLLFVLLVGFCVWILWGMVIPIILPRAVKAGFIAKSIDLWTAILLSFLCSILFKSTTGSSKK